MALPLKLPSLSPPFSYPYITSSPTLTFVFPQNIHPLNSSSSLSPTHPNTCLPNTSKHRTTSSSFRVSYRFSPSEDDDDDENISFNEAAALFNKRDYYKCHDFLEAQWMQAEEPVRTLLHGILQCAVGFHHLFNQNHKGAMMELGEGLCKLRKMNFKSGPFLRFEQEISATLDFIYETQIEQAACSEDMCLAMDQSERSYQLLGGYGAGQRLYNLQTDPNQIVYIEFCPQRSNGTIRVKLPTLAATEEHLMALI